jgi:chaperonin GroEL (HSP60 family)
MAKDYYTSDDEVGTLVCDETPKVNIMTKSEFMQRACQVFGAYEEILRKTLGAYGSPTIISNYPYQHITKDGYTVCRNIEFDAREGSEVDKVIGGMVTGICSRLNYAVGDGTTSAIIATNQVFKAICNREREFKGVRSRDIMKKFGEVKDEIVEKIQKQATPITPDNMVDTIRKIVNISSNGDEKLVEFITEAYEQIGFPSIVCEKSDNNDTYISIVDGYTANVKLGDPIYINTENDTAKYKNADVIIFSHKVTLDTYRDIIVPLNEISKVCNRNLICLAPWYDEKALSGAIRRDLQKEYNKEGKINLVVCSYFNSTDIAKQQIADLAIVLGTTVIDKDLEDRIMERIDKGEVISNIVNCFDRGIGGLIVFPDHDKFDNGLRAEDGKIYDQERYDNTLFTLGFADDANLGDKSSIFNGTHYNEGLYQAALVDAERKLNDVISKFEVLGTYTRDVYDAQNRLSSLKMKLATLYVGGDSDLSREMLKDSAEDAIRAAESAYRYGYVDGCNLSIIIASEELLHDGTNDPLRSSILECINEAFREVYRDVLLNAFGEVYVGYDDITLEDDHLVINNYHYGDNDNDEMELCRAIVNMSVPRKKVLNLETNTFSNDVINSAKTDIEILTATTDLLSLLLVGNQVVLASWNHSRTR